jgi:hypothetical protein
MDQPTEPIDINIDLIYRAAQNAARVVIPRHLTRWREDIVQEVVMASVLNHRKGYRTTRTWYRRVAIDALRRIFGDERKSRGRREDYVMVAEIQDVAAVVHDSSARRYARGLSVRRLQEAWGALSARQRAGIFCMMTDPDITAEVAAAMGTSSSVLVTSRTDALRAIDDASAVARARARTASPPVPERPCIEGCSRMAKGRHRRCWICGHKRSRPKS